MASVSLSCSATSLRAATVAREGHARRADRGQRYRGRVFSARPGASHRGEASTSTSSDDLDDLISAVASGARDLTRSEIDRLISELNLTSLCDAACAVRAAGPDPGIVTFSPKVFVPLTFACRDRCGYCTFAKDPEAGSKIYMSLEQVIDVAERGRVAGATECLFTLGDRPEALYPAAKHELNEMGFESTVDYLAHCASAVLARTGLLPHCNAGVLTRTELAKLREVSVSQGLMLESTSDRLVDEPGAAHFNCESKRPAARIRTLDLAGELDVPFTSGILVGIGETREERVDALFAIRESDRKWRGHVQEVIVQNFRAKENTGMRDWPEPSLDELAWTAACARLIFGPVTQIQVPPNLTPEPDDAAGGGPVGDREGWRRLLRCGVSDWGGVSPGVTPDHVSPEAPWPHLSELARVTAEEGYSLVPRLAAQARYVVQKRSKLATLTTRDEDEKTGQCGFSLSPVRVHETEGLERWIDARLAPHVRVLADSEGFARASGWCVRVATSLPKRSSRRRTGNKRSRGSRRGTRSRRTSSAWTAPCSAAEVRVTREGRTDHPAALPAFARRSRGFNAAELRSPRSNIHSCAKSTAAQSRILIRIRRRRWTSTRPRWRRFCARGALISTPCAPPRMRRGRRSAATR